MAARRTRTPTTAPVASGADTLPACTPWTWAMDAGRQQVELASQGAGVLFRGFEQLQRMQQEAAQQATRRHAAAGAKLRAGAGPADLLALQGELLREDLQAVAGYWQQLAGTVLELQTEWFASAARLVDTEDVLAATSPRILHS